jgi:hypothetical protein
LVSAEIVHQRTLLSDRAEAERDKMARMKRLRLEKEAAARLAAASEPVTETQSAELLRKPSGHPQQSRGITKPIESQDFRINTKNLFGMAHATKARWRSLLIARSAATAGIERA